MAAKKKGKKKAVKKAAGRKPVAQRAPRKPKPAPDVESKDGQPTSVSSGTTVEVTQEATSTPLPAELVEVPATMGGTVGLDQGDGATQIEDVPGIKDDEGVVETHLGGLDDDGEEDRTADELEEDDFDVDDPDDDADHDEDE